MDSFNLILHNVPLTAHQLLALLTAALCSFIIYRLIFAADHEAPIEYSIPIPEQCSPQWESRVLEQPDIKAGPAPHHPLGRSIELMH